MISPFGQGYAISVNGRQGTLDLSDPNDPFVFGESIKVSFDANTGSLAFHVPSDSPDLVVSVDFYTGHTIEYPPGQIIAIAGDVRWQGFARGAGEAAQLRIQTIEGGWVATPAT